MIVGIAVQTGEFLPESSSIDYDGEKMAEKDYGT
jgi:hypothetical protein